MRSFAVFFVVSLAVCTAQMDSVVPEDTLSEELTTEHSRNLEFAASTVDALADDSKCKKLAEDMKKEVETSTSTDQKTLDAINDAVCDKEGTGLVANAKSQLAAREKELAAATKAKLAARSAKVSFTALRFADISEKACSSQFFGQSTYVTATQRTVDTAKFEAKKKGEVEGAKTALKAAEAEASRLQAACRCRMKAAAIKAFNTLSKNNAARKETYGRANMLLCVLAKKNLSDKSCTADGMPTLKMPKGVHEDFCVKYEATQITSKCSTTCGQSAKTLSAPIRCVGIRGNSEPESKCSAIKLLKPPANKLGCPATKACAKWVTEAPTSSCPMYRAPAHNCGLSASTKCGSVRCKQNNGQYAADSVCAGQAKPSRNCKNCPATQRCWQPLYQNHVSGIGGWGGTCRCPDGKDYQVGDWNDSCRSLGCAGGRMISCHRRDGVWSRKAVTCDKNQWPINFRGYRL